GPPREALRGTPARVRRPGAPAPCARQPHDRALGQLRGVWKIVLAVDVAPLHRGRPWEGQRPASALAHALRRRRCSTGPRGIFVPHAQTRSFSEAPAEALAPADPADEAPPGAHRGAGTADQ